MKRTPIDGLTIAIKATLEQYGEDVFGIAAEAVKQITKAGVKAVRDSAKEKFNTSTPSPYLKGWTSRFEEGRTSAQGTIYNKDVPGLPHLLEFGHVSRNGTGRTFGRVEGRPHIAPVENKLAEELQSRIRREL